MHPYAIRWLGRHSRTGQHSVFSVEVTPESYAAGCQAIRESGLVRWNAPGWVIEGLLDDVLVRMACTRSDTTDAHPMRDDAARSGSEWQFLIAR